MPVQVKTKESKIRAQNAAFVILYIQRHQDIGKQLQETIAFLISHITVGTIQQMQEGGFYLPDFREIHFFYGV